MRTLGRPDRVDGRERHAVRVVDLFLGRLAEPGFEQRERLGGVREIARLSIRPFLFRRALGLVCAHGCQSSLNSWRPPDNAGTLFQHLLTMPRHNPKH